MHKDKHGNIIGTGEDTVYHILCDLYKGHDIKRQYKFTELMSDEFKDTLGERQLKETLDIVLFRPKDKTIVVRVQDKHHTGVRTSGVDLIQKTMLEWNNCIVVDLWFYDCPNIWKEEVNEASRTELLTIFRSTEGIF